ncbi:MAG TPA: porin [Steroidobacteraceae bacterium]|jgi:predicted porin
MRRASALLLLGTLAGSGAACDAEAAPDDSLTWHGMTLYGLVDIGLQYENHGAPFSESHPAGGNNIVQKYGREAAFGFTPSNMSQSRIGLQGAEALTEEVKAIFRMETFFNPQSGQISDAQKSMVQNNGRSVADQTVNLNSSVAGQPFQNIYGGFSSKSYGTVTFGRQLTLVADGVNKYDPNYGSQACSLVGMSGPYAGAGDTEDKRLDSSVKYLGTVAEVLHLGAMYKFNGASGAANTAYQFNLGAEYARLSVDAYYSKVTDAIANGALSATQVATLPAAFSVSNSLSATISDNRTFAIMALYKLQPLILFGSYERVRYSNPRTPLKAGFTDIGGYNLGFVNNTAFANDKILDVFWGGARYSLLSRLDLTVAYYNVHQNSYGTGANAGCSTKVAGTCSGTLEAASVTADYTVTRHFDVYLGAMYSAVHDGFANGYLFSTNNINPTIGVRLKF